MTKSEARKSVYSRLEVLSDKEIRSAEITEKLLNMGEIARADSVAAYMALENEVNLDAFIKKLLISGKSVFVPVVRDGMRFVKVTENTEFITGKFGVREPIGEENYDNFDAIVVPMVAFDEKKNRLGHGKGYYDKFLKNLSVFKIGVAFDTQEESFDTESTDIKMDAVVTETRLIR